MAARVCRAIQITPLLSSESAIRGAVTFLTKYHSLKLSWAFLVSMKQGNTLVLLHKSANTRVDTRRVFEISLGERYC